MRGLLKTISIMLALVMFTVSFAACTNTNREGNQQSTQPSNQGSQQNDEKPKGPPVELTIMVFDRGIQGNAPVDNNYLTQWVNEEFGKPNNINVKFIPVPRSEELQKLNVWMASDEAPDLIYTFGPEIVYQYAEAGGLTDLGPYLEQHGQDLHNYLGDDLLNYGKYEGSLYAIPGNRTKRGIVASAIRKDWLDILGLPVPQTTDAWVETLRAFKAKDPGGLGNGTIPFGISMADITWGYFGMLYNSKQEMPDETYRTTIEWLNPGYKDGVRLLNTLYNEGLISSEFALDKDGKKLAENIANGKVGFYTHNLGSYFGTEIPALYNNVPTAEIAAVDPFVNHEGKRLKLGLAPYGLFSMVPKSSKHAAEVIQYLNWMSDPEVFTTLNNGLEGVHYKIVDGFPVPKEGDYEKVFNTDYVPIIEGYDFGDNSKLFLSESKRYIEELQPVYLEMAENAHTDLELMSMGHITMAYLPKSNTAVREHGPALRAKHESMIATLIMSKPNEFDTHYDRLVKEFLNSGGQEVMDEAKKIYNETK